MSDAQRPLTSARRLATALAGGLAAAVAAAAPRAAHACYVCMSGRDDETGSAFLLGSVALSLLPFATFGGIGVYLWRRVRAAERARADAERGPAEA